MGKDQLSNLLVVSICFRIILDWYQNQEPCLFRYAVKFVDSYHGWQVSPKRVFGFSWISFCFNTICFTFWFIFLPSYTVVFITIRRILLKCSKHLEKTYVPMKFSMDTKNWYIFSQESPEFRSTISSWILGVKKNIYPGRLYLLGILAQLVRMVSWNL